MLKSVEIIERPHTPQIVLMKDMEPLQLGRIIKSPIKDQIGNIILRTASGQHFEVINLTVIGVGMWGVNN